MPASIWKDYEVSFGNVAEADYTIETNGAEIFSGHAVRRPDTAQLLVRINDVCADYLSHILPSVTARGAANDPCAVTFTVKDAGGNTVDAVQFVDDWSFDYDHPVSALSDPINGHLSAAQALVFSVLSSAATPVTLRFKDGTTQALSIASTGGPVQVVSVPLSSIANLAGITAGGRSYTIVDACHRFALLYVNAFGGWDTLLMEGLSMAADGYTRHLMAQRYDNNAASARGIKEYVNEVARRWTLRTGWLSDGEAQRMHHVFGSTTVYLYDIPAGVAVPVTIGDDTCEYKTYRNTGAQMVNYTITANLAQELIRR